MDWKDMAGFNSLFLKPIRCHKTTIATPTPPPLCTNQDGLCFFQSKGHVLPDALFSRPQNLFSFSVFGSSAMSLLLPCATLAFISPKLHFWNEQRENVPRSTVKQGFYLVYRFLETQRNLQHSLASNASMLRFGDVACSNLQLFVFRTVKIIKNVMSFPRVVLIKPSFNNKLNLSCSELSVSVLSCQGGPHSLWHAQTGRAHQVCVCVGHALAYRRHPDALRRRPASHGRLHRAGPALRG